MHSFTKYFKWLILVNHIQESSMRADVMKCCKSTSSLSCIINMATKFYNYSAYKIMSSQHENIKEQAEIYQKLTRKKCTIFHRNDSLQEDTCKLPRASRHNRFMTEPMYHEKSSMSSQSKSYHIRQCQKNSSSIFTPKNNNQIFFNVLKNGIKIDLSDRKPSAQSKSNIYIKTVSKKSSTKKQNPELFTPPPIKKKSENTIITEQLSFPTPYNTVAYNSLGNSNSEKNQQQTSQIKKINFIDLNKSNVVKSKNKKSTASISVNAGLMGKSKKEMMVLERKNREQTTLQQEIRAYHLKTKSLVEEMKVKYHLNFAKDKKYLPKKKKDKQMEVFEVNDETTMTTIAYIREEQIKFDKIKEEIQCLDKRYQESRLKLIQIQQTISNNQFESFLTKTANSDQFPQVNEPILEEQQPNDSAKSFHQKINIIQKLKQSLIKLKQRNVEDAKADTLGSIKVNDRLKDLLFK